MKPPLQGTQALDRAAVLLAALIDDGGATPLRGIAAATGIAAPTAYRMAAQLVRQGLLVRLGRGRYTSGLALFRLAARRSVADVATAAARPLLRRLAQATGRTAHLGTFDGEMVTYLVREAPPGGHVFTREAMQLEAYCSAIGKMLLAMRSEAARDAYLAAGGFVPLTSRTITDEPTLRANLRLAAIDGFATDDEEAEAGLFCLAVGVDLPFDEPQFALSLAGTVPEKAERAVLLATIQAAAVELRDMLGAA